MPDAAAPGPLLDLADAALGTRPAARAVRVTRAGSVFELVADDGRRWFGKVCLRAHRYRAELAAYRQWVPTLGDRAPSLVADDDRAQLLLLTAVPGAGVAEPGAEVLAAAGLLLRDYHASCPPCAAHLAGEMARQAEVQLARSRRAGLAVDERWVRRQVAVVAGLGPLPVVASHGDFLPRNWLVDASGTVRVVDFAESRPHAAAYDVARLVLACWHRLAWLDALLAGYGRRLSEAEARFVDAQLTLSALAALTWATRHRRPGKRARAAAVLAAQRDGYRFRPR